MSKTEFEIGLQAAEELQWADRAMRRYNPRFTKVMGTIGGILFFFCVSAAIQDPTHAWPILLFSWLPGGLLFVSGPALDQEAKDYLKGKEIWAKWKEHFRSINENHPS